MIGEKNTVFMYVVFSYTEVACSYIMKYKKVVHSGMFERFLLGRRYIILYIYKYILR